MQTNLSSSNQTLVKQTGQGIFKLRWQIAAQYLSGHGLEIGALHQPLSVPAGVQVSYVDRMSVEELKKQYPRLRDQKLVEVSIVDDGEILSSIENSSVDFVIANHMIEHCQNPIGTLQQHLRVLKTGGFLYMAVPDKRYTFDRDRSLTSLDHVIDDYMKGPERSYRSHFVEWVRLVEKIPEEQFEQRILNLISIDYSIHFHVWTQSKFLELLLFCKDKLLFPFEIELVQNNGAEFIVLLRKELY